MPADNPPAAPLDSQIDLFFKALQGEDDLGMVVRAHIHIEHELDQFLHIFVDEGYLKKMSLEYQQRVYLAAAVGLKDDLVSPLKAIGKLRNDFAHRLGMKLTSDREKALYKTLSPTEQQVMQGSFDRTKQTHPQMYAEKRLADLVTPDLFVFIAITLRSALVAACIQARRAITSTPS